MAEKNIKRSDWMEWLIMGNTVMNYLAHEYANLFPLMNGAEFSDLKDDIKTRGLREPVVMFDGKILDGRNRFRACQEVGAEIKVIEYAGDDPLADVISWNLKRRHLNESQRAAIAAQLANLPNGVRSDRSSANLQSLPPVSQTAAAEMLNVSPRSVATASKVKDESPVLFESLKSGDISTNLASKVIELPEEDQTLIEALNESPDEMRKVAKEIVHNHRAQGTGENEWYTPDQYLNAAREFMGGFDIDPASSELANKTVKANRFFDIEANGLNQEWFGKVWMNPPYSQPDIRLFIEKLVSEYESGNVTEAIALTHNYTDTSWFHTAINTASAVCFTRGRIGFVNPEGKKASPTQGQAFIYFGLRPKKFSSVFSQFGKVLFCE